MLVSQRKELNKHPGIVRSPLLNIVRHDPVLSILLLRRVNNESSRSIQTFKKEVKSAGSPRLWFADGVIVTVGLIDSGEAEPPKK